MPFTTPMTVAVAVALVACAARDVLGSDSETVSATFAKANNPDLGGCGWSRCVKCQGGPCGPQNQKCIGSPPKFTFHLNDPTCDINDPNGPMYDPVHGMYHNFYQIHIAEDQDGAGDGPDWGHWVSRDFVKWAQLPVAIWNDHYYDNSAIFTGSTTIVDGKPVIVYPGKCKGKNGQGCNDGKGGFTYVLSVPEDPSDPLYTNWTKSGQISGKPFTNPIVNFTGDDPSTAWQTKDGEWRLIGNQGCAPEGGHPLYGSMDFVSWYKIGCTTLQAGDCPTFFELPALTPGSEHYVVGAGLMPDHVHKSGDAVQVGNWVEGKPGPAGTGTVGTWTLTPGSVSMPLDLGHTHAAKDFFDPVKSRHIMWNWGTQPAYPSGIQTIPRTMTYHPGLKQIVYSPVEEMVQLRSGTLEALPTTSLKANSSTTLKASAASEIQLYFKLPTATTNIVVGIGKSSVTLDFVPDSGSGVYTVRVGAGGKMTGLSLLPDDTVLDVHVFLDNVVGEAYWQGGRVAMCFPTEPVTSVSLLSTADVMLLNATSYTVGDIHTTVQDVLSTPRLH